MKDTDVTGIRREYIINKIAEGASHGLNCREIVAELTLAHVTKAELVWCVWYLIENPPTAE